MSFSPQRDASCVMFCQQLCQPAAPEVFSQTSSVDIFRIYIFIYTFVLHLKLRQDAFRTYCLSSAVPIELISPPSPLSRDLNKNKKSFPQTHHHFKRKPLEITTS